MICTTSAEETTKATNGQKRAAGMILKSTSTSERRADFVLVIFFGCCVWFRCGGGFVPIQMYIRAQQTHAYTNINTTGPTCCAHNLTDENAGRRAANKSNMHK